MPVNRIIELRKLLVEKYPGLPAHFDGEAGGSRRRWATGLPAVDGALNGGLPHGELTEMVAGGRNSGSASVLRAMLDQAAGNREIIALVDGSDSLDVSGIQAATLARLLWIRCRDAGEALKAADLLLRDHNFSLVLLDLAGNPPAEFRQIPATTWHRLHYLVEATSTVCVVLTARPMVGPARVRITLRLDCSLAALEVETDELLRGLKLEVSEATQLRQQRIAI